MRLLKLYVTLFSLVFQSGAFALSGGPTRVGSLPIEKCLNVSTNLASDCMKQYLKVKTLNSCYTMSNIIYSNQSKENVKNYCFYNISEFPTLKTCVDAAKRFYISENKDHALFECVRQFSSAISEKNCLSISKMMTYKDKSKHLENHCRNL